MRTYVRSSLRAINDLLICHSITVLCMCIIALLGGKSEMNNMMKEEMSKAAVDIEELRKARLKRNEKK